MSFTFLRYKQVNL